MIRNWYLKDLSNDIAFLEELREIGETYRIFFPFLTEARREINNYPFWDFDDEDKLESGMENKDVYAICRKAKIPLPILVEHFVMSSIGDMAFKRGRMGQLMLELKDRVQYDFTASSPFKRFCIGIGKYDTKTEGRLYMCVMIDLYDYSVAALSFSETKGHDLLDEVLDHMVQFSPCRDVLVHSSQNAIFQKEDYRRLCSKHGIVASMTEKGSRGGIAPISTFFSSLKRNMNGYEFTDLQDGIDWLTVYILKYNLTIISKGKDHEDSSSQ